ncbi:MAG: hypothetical protein ACLVD7_06340, partial [[Clostridium] leptum]
FTIQGKSPVKIALNNEGQDAPAAPPDKIKNSDDFGWVCVIVPAESTTRTISQNKSKPRLSEVPSQCLNLFF